MSQDWEELFREWAKPPGKTEQDRCDNAVSAIRNAIRTSNKLSPRGVSVFVQGSYRNNTNVRKDSDVDIGILCTDTFFYEPLPDGWTEERLGFSDATYHYDQYKDRSKRLLKATSNALPLNGGTKLSTYTKRPITLKPT